MYPYAVMLDITDQIPGLEGTLLMSAWIFAPHDQAKGIIFCLDSKASYHLVVPGYPADAYSFASFLAHQGWLVIALESLGMGESTHLEQETLSMEMLVCANEVAFQQILVHLLQNDFDFSLPRMEYPSVTMCIGYGNGALLAIAQQAQYRRYDALVLSGWSTPQWSFDGNEMPKEAIHPENFRTTVEDDERMQKFAALIDVPLFLCRQEGKGDNLLETAYPWSPEITTVLLRGFAHQHASIHHRLWIRVNSWLHQIFDQCVERKRVANAE
jgi:hypothetical protein